MPGLLIIRPNEGIFFANAEPLREAILAEIDAAEEPLQAVILDLEMSNELDAPSAEMLAALVNDLDTRELSLLLARVHPDVLELLARGAALESIEEHNIHGRTYDAVLAHFRQQGDDVPAVVYLIQEEMQRLAEIAGDTWERADDAEAMQLQLAAAELNRTAARMEAIKTAPPADQST